MVVGFECCRNTNTLSAFWGPKDRRLAVESVTLYERRDELARVLQSKLFAKAKKKSRFLEFVCDQSFLGNADKLNEYLIGVEVYERGTDFNPQDDPIVRVQAHEIRRALKEYYEEEGKDSPFRLELPPGHYIPVFTRIVAQPEAPPGPAPTLGIVTRFIRPNGLVVGLAVTCLVLAMLLIRERARHSEGVPTAGATASLPEGMEWFWKPFLPPAGPALIVIPNHPLLRAAHDGDSAQTLASVHEIPKKELPEFRDTIHFRELKRFLFVPSSTDFTAVGEAVGLFNLFELFSSVGQRCILQQSRIVTFEEIKRGNTILLGGNQAWSGRVFLNPEGFRFQAGVILNKNPRPGEQPLYKPEFDPVTNHLTRDYALILMVPNEKKENRILLIYGIYTQGSQAAIEYVTSPERLPELRKALAELSPDRKSLPSYFQALVETTVENYVPGKASLVAARIIP